MFPKALRPSSHRAYAVLLRKTRRRPTTTGRSAAKGNVMSSFHTWRASYNSRVTLFVSPNLKYKRAKISIPSHIPRVSSSADTPARSVSCNLHWLREENGCAGKVGGGEVSAGKRGKEVAAKLTE